MTDGEEELQLIIRGKQKKAVAQSMTRPMTCNEIWNISKKSAPRIQLRDIYKIIRTWLKHQLVSCVYRADKNGSIFYWTPKGMKLYALAFDIGLAPFNDLRWDLYSKITIGKARLAVFLEIGYLTYHQDSSVTAAQVRRSIKLKYPIGLNPTIRAIQELVELNVVELAGISNKGQSSLYKLNSIGSEIFLQMQK